jgi:NAD(P)-dependent dehydrogenase (short-subunit alcohol dehydrogenase family)
MSRQLLEGKCCVVTGGGSGIGAAAALDFCRHGAKVVVADLNGEAASAVAREINEEMPGQCVSMRADVSSQADTVAMVDMCRRSFGAIHVFFANAGVLNKHVPIAEEPEEQFMRTLAVNTLSVFMAIKYAGQAIVQCGGGSIICTASIAALRADLTPLQYTASKGAVLAMIKSANDRLMVDGVRVNAVVPGGVMTPLMLSVANNLEKEGLELAGYDYKRFPPVDPSAIANVVTFLASDLSSAVKGQAIKADGGMTNSMGSQPYPSKKKPKAPKMSKT